MNELKIKALMQHLDCDRAEAEQQLDEQNYLVLTDEEATKMANEYIRASLWAFNTNFLASETGIDAEVFAAIAANNRCESNNSAIRRLIGNDIESFCENAIAADGRAHFLSTYDGHEHEIRINDQYLYVYRIN